VLSPFLFVLHRLAVFHTVPYDDYAPYLLWTAGTGQGFVPDSPYCYRLLAMVAALPFFWVAPPLGLTNTPAGESALWLRATLALDLLNYLALVAAAMLTARTASRRCGLSRPEAILAGATVFALGWFVQLDGIDGVAMLLISAGLALVENPIAFTALMLVAVGMDEKVPLVLALWLGARVVLVGRDRGWLIRPFAAAAGAVIVYFAMVAILHLPGNEYQTDPSGFIGTVRRNLSATLSARGAILNILPVAVLTGLAIYGHAHHAPVATPLFRAVDGLVIAGLCGVALMFTQFYQAGRIVMHAAPLFAIPAVAALRNRRPRITA
jgi:hypothetical protein